MDQAFHSPKFSEKGPLSPLLVRVCVCVCVRLRFPVLRLPRKRKSQRLSLPLTIISSYTLPCSRHIPHPTSPPFLYPPSQSSPKNGSNKNFPSILQSSPSNMHPTHATLLFLDWDSTLTTSSTLPLIASATTYPEAHPAWGGLGRRYGEERAESMKRGEKGGWEGERRYLVFDSLIYSTIPVTVCCDRV